MQHIDFTNLHRSTVGFDHLFNMLDNIGKFENSQNSYPPYNIQRFDDNNYRISLAVAGFSDEDISIEVKEHQLNIVGKKEADTQVEYLHQGIAARAFERNFQLADHVEVLGAKLENGLLHIELKRELPEKMKPKQISIERVDQVTSKTIEAEKETSAVQ